MRLLATQEVKNARQRRIRDAEWACVKPWIAPYRGGRFLDVGCGTGFALAKAATLGFDVVGLEPSPHAHGVEDDAGTVFEGTIIHGQAERLPFETATFDVVYSSHALEHFDNQKAGLGEMARVLKPGGRAVIVVPTAFMALLGVFSRFVFNSHRAVGKAVLRPRWQNLRNVVLLTPHGSQTSTAFKEPALWTMSRWSELVGRSFDLVSVELGMLYPYPDFPQLFPLCRARRLASSLILVGARKP